jgi:hypothetical protein
MSRTPQLFRIIVALDGLFTSGDMSPATKTTEAR